MLDLIIIGSGPFGISLAAHAVANRLSYKLFGYPMDFWKNKMPQNMFIRTPYDFVSFPDANDEFTIHRFAEESGIDLADPLPRPIFVDYAIWFSKKTGVEFTPEHVAKLEFDGEAYTAITETGQTAVANNVIIATGVEHYKYIPELFKEIPEAYLTHTFGYTSFEKFKNQNVAVIGSGQSAWEAAGLLHESGANVELIYRRESANYAGSRAAERYLRMMGNAFYHLPVLFKKEQWGQSPGSVAHFLRPFVEGKVAETGNVTVDQVHVTDNNKVQLLLSNGEERIVDHIISASGYRIHLDKVPFLPDELKAELVREEGFTQFPKLDQNFESSLKGLYFAGPLSSHSHGPTFRFILGLRKTARTIIPAIKRSFEVETACC